MIFQGDLAYLVRQLFLKRLLARKDQHSARILWSKKSAGSHKRNLAFNQNSLALTYMDKTQGFHQHKIRQIIELLIIVFCIMDNLETFNKQKTNTQAKMVSK